MTGTLFDLEQIKTEKRDTCEAEIRNRCRGQYLGDYEIICRCLGRYSMVLDTRDAGFASHIIMDGFWEYWITKFMIDTVQQGFTVLDIGANFGYYSLLLSDLVGPDGFCLAVEPNPLAVRKLKKNIAINGFVSRSKVLPAALGRSSSGQVSIFVPTEEPKNACIVSPDFTVPPDLSGFVEQVQMTSADVICAKLSKVDFVKIDAEGSELEIIFGMLGTMQRLRPKLLLEFNANRDYDAGLLLATLSEIYGAPKFLDNDAKLKEVARLDLLSRERQDDWMLYYE